MKRLFAVLAVPLLSGVVAIDLVRALRYVADNRYWKDGQHYLAVTAVQRVLDRGLVFALAAIAVLLVVSLLLGRRGRSTPFLFGLAAVEAVLLVNRALHGRDWGVTTERFGIGLPNALWRTELLGQVALTAAAAAAVAFLAWRFRGVLRGRRPPAALGWAAVVLAGLVLVGANVAPRVVHPSPCPRPFNVIFLSLDSTRSDHLSPYGYARPTMPRMGAFFRDAVQFEDDVAQANWTRPSYFSIMTSRYKWEFPPQHVSLPLLTLAETLKQHGYHTMGFVQNPNLDYSLHFDQGFDSYYQVYKDLRAATMRRVVVSRIDKLDPDDGPLFLFMHLQQPHYPYDPDNPYLPAFEREDDYELSPDEVLHYFTGDEEHWQNGEGDPHARLEYLNDAYDASLRATDAALWAVLSALKRRGFLENALVILNADHGEEIQDHGGMGHAHHNLHSELVEVPLFLRFPDGLGVRPGVRTTVAANLDIYPTILDVTGIRSDRKMYGRSLLPLLRGEAWEPRDVFSNRTKWMSVTGPRYRLHVDWNGETPEQIFDLWKDPGEKHPLSLPDDDSSLVRLRNASQQWYDMSAALRARKHGKGKGKGDGELNKSLREDLEALGYVGGGGD